MSSPERLGDNRRVFIAVVREFQGNTPHKSQKCSDIDKSNSMNYGHARRNQSGIAPLDTARYCISRHGNAISPPALPTEPRKGFSDFRRESLSRFILDGPRIAFCRLFRVNSCNPSCAFVDLHWIIHSHIRRIYPRQTFQFET